MDNNFTFCRFCHNAFVDPELDHDNDLSYLPIGKCAEGYYMFLRSGSRIPTAVFLDKAKEGGCQTIAVFLPRYCPICGRYLFENFPNDKSFDEK